MKLGVVILAAGASSRMGRPKLLLPWGSGTVLAHLLSQWRSLAPMQSAIVCAAPEQHQPLHEELERLGWPRDQRIINPQPERGMFSSIQCAAAWSEWNPQLTHWAIALGDQPLVRSETLRDLLDFAGRHPGQVCQPSRQGRGRHPVLVPAPVFARLPQAKAENLKQFLIASGLAVARCESDDPGLDLDLDEPADYARALAGAAPRHLGQAGPG
jgi:molybdenum cofactor cytidylyltransferase